MTAIATHSEGKVARPLSVLVPLIKKDLELAREAAQRVSLPYYAAAGEKMLEAKPQQTNPEFRAWLRRNFNLGYAQACDYMKVAGATSSRIREGGSLNKYLGEIGDPRHVDVTRKKAWHDGVQENIERARREAERVREESLTRQQEREAEQKLALRLIDIGYRILAKELHPDKGGSRDAMQRLGRVRDRLRQHA
jgi:hypothetical protein